MSIWHFHDDTIAEPQDGDIISVIKVEGYYKVTIGREGAAFRTKGGDRYQLVPIGHFSPEDLAKVLAGFIGFYCKVIRNDNNLLVVKLYGSR